MKRVIPVLIVYILLLNSIYSENESNEYVLGKGETIYRVSKLKNVPVETIIEINKIEDATKIKEGTRIILPRVHIVEKGETLFSISRKYDIKIDDLIKLNGLRNPENIKVGQRLFLPVKDNEKSKELFNDKNDNKNEKSDVLWPLNGEIVRYRGKLSGVKIKGEKGEKIISVSSGKVIWSSPYRGYGNVVFIESKNGYIYGYLGNANVSVKVGESVSVGTEIGRLELNSRNKEAFILFIVYKNGKAIDVFKAPRK